MDHKTAPSFKTDAHADANAIFQRVWNRVMSNSQDCPIVVDPLKAMSNCYNAPNPAKETEEVLMSQSKDNPAAALPACSNMQAELKQEAMDMTAQESTLLPMRTDNMGASNPADCPYKDDFPPRTDVPCLGLQSANFESVLQDRIDKELQNWLYYRSLARRVGGSAARVFASMAADDWQNAKRLSAVYFLISGVHYWPEKNNKIHITSYLTALRNRFIEEQQDAAFYVAAATESNDPCLSQLFLELAEGNLRHACQIRLLVEQV